MSKYGRLYESVSDIRRSLQALLPTALVGNFTPADARAKAREWVVGLCGGECDECVPPLHVREQTVAELEGDVRGILEARVGEPIKAACRRVMDERDAATEYTFRGPSGTWWARPLNEHGIWTIGRPGDVGGERFGRDEAIAKAREFAEAPVTPSERTTQPKGDE
jgi:hypothetical protein